jgi:hypothetical protein
VNNALIKHDFCMTQNIKMKSFSLLFSWIIFTNLFSQNTEVDKIYKEIYHKTQSKYGIDLELVNGIIYDKINKRTIGHPFFLEPKLYKGELVFRRKSYHNIELLFDLYKQQILINYTLDSIKIWLLLPSEHISEFSLYKKNFKKYSLKGLPTGFYQVIGNPDSIMCLYHWNKNRRAVGYTESDFLYEYTNELKTCYLLMDNIFARYTNNLSFIKLFPDEIKRDIRKYIRNNQILNVTRSSDIKVSELIDYCYKLKSSVK